MKNIILASVVLVSSIGVYAGDYCKVVSSLAESTMRARQGGLPASEAGEVATGAPESVRRLVQEMVEQAYYFPTWNSDEAQREEISEFSNAWFFACLNALGGK